MTKEDLDDVRTVARLHWPNRLKIIDALVSRIEKAHKSSPHLETGNLLRFTCRVGYEVTRATTIGYVSRVYAELVKEFEL